jgi:hypothetical protein
VICSLVVIISDPKARTFNGFAEEVDNWNSYGYQFAERSKNGSISLLQFLRK